MPARKLFMGSTEIDPQKTVGEITSKLVAAGARQIAMSYSEQGEIVGIQFMLPIGAGQRLFALPARVDPVFEIINGARKSLWDQEEMEEKDRARARRVAWRQLLRWVEAQLAMIESGMVDAQEVFLPYMQDRDGKTLYERVLEAPEFLALPPPGTRHHCGESDEGNEADSTLERTGRDGLRRRDLRCLS